MVFYSSPKHINNSNMSLRGSFLAGVKVSRAGAHGFLSQPPTVSLCLQVHHRLLGPMSVAAMSNVASHVSAIAASWCAAELCIHVEHDLPNENKQVFKVATI